MADFTVVRETVAHALAKDKDRTRCRTENNPAAEPVIDRTQAANAKYQGVRAFVQGALPSVRAAAA
jgi:hypothetical protein